MSYHVPGDFITAFHKEERCPPARASADQEGDGLSDSRGF